MRALLVRSGQPYDRLAVLCGGYQTATKALGQLASVDEAGAGVEGAK